MVEDSIGDSPSEIDIRYVCSVQFMYLQKLLFAKIETLENFVLYGLCRATFRPIHFGIDRIYHLSSIRCRGY